LSLRVFDATARDVESVGIRLNPNEQTALLHRCDAGCAAAHKRI
jgi:hypothetical protein